MYSLREPGNCSPVTTSPAPPASSMTAANTSCRCCETRPSRPWHISPPMVIIVVAAAVAAAEVAAVRVAALLLVVSTPAGVSPLGLRFRGAARLVAGVRDAELPVLDDLAGAVPRLAHVHRAVSLLLLDLGRAAALIPTRVRSAELAAVQGALGAARLGAGVLGTVCPGAHYEVQHRISRHQCRKRHGAIRQTALVRASKDGTLVGAAIRRQLHPDALAVVASQADVVAATPPVGHPGLATARRITGSEVCCELVSHCLFAFWWVRSRDLRSSHLVCRSPLPSTKRKLLQPASTHRSCLSQ